MVSLSRLVLGLCLVVAAVARIESDLVDPETLPGWNQPLPFSLYSGHLKVRGPQGLTYVHYQFMESLDSPHTKPTVMWQNGGPGASSVSLGLFTEVGYLHVNVSSLNSNPPRVFANQNSWNRFANMLYFDHPPGVGFSYCVSDNKSAVPCYFDDYTQAEQLYETLQEFFTNFPEFSKTDVYFAAESYGGIFIPSTVYHYTTQKNSRFNLAGFSVGNGCINIPGASRTNPGLCNGYKEQQYVVDQLFHAGFMSQETRDAVYDACTFPLPCSRYPTNFSRSLPNAKCQATWAAMANAVGNLNPYNIYDNCPDAQTSIWLCASSSGDVPQPGGNLYSCVGNANDVWLANPAVQEALHLNGTFGLSSFNYVSYVFSSYDHYQYLVKNFRILIYSGDVDNIVPWMQNEGWVSDIVQNNMSFPVTDDWRTWSLPNSSIVAGRGRTLGGNFTYVTVRNAGHMVPQYQPERAFHMMERFIHRKPF